MHATAWLNDDFDIRIAPNGEADLEARSWFASARLALLAPYGVGTIDQALQAVVAVRHFPVRRFGLSGKVVILDEVHSYDVYTGTLITALIRELVALGCYVIVLSATLTAARRRELLAAAGVVEQAAPASYPLVTTTKENGRCCHVAPEWTERKRVAVRAELITETETAAELISRASRGQHVSWIRNTVRHAQSAFGMVNAMMPPGDIRIGLMHSRFPVCRRAALEDDWLEFLGPNRPANGPGIVLIATQVVEQSVDIDLDFITSDLAPTDMLLQRLGRLWRHNRAVRAADQPEFWVRVPDIPAGEVTDIREALGRSARVYAPYVLVRSADVWRGRHEIMIPGDIRPMLEATYTDPPANEPAGWTELRTELETKKAELAATADAATRVLGRPALPDADELLTRVNTVPTIDVILLRSVSDDLGGYVIVEALDGRCARISTTEWWRSAAKFLHRWLVPLPFWMVPPDVPRPDWLSLHARGAVHAVVQDDGQCLFGDIPSATFYDPVLGAYADGD